MKIIKLNAIINKIIKIKKIKRENNFENNRIPIDNKENRENMLITFENHENYENHEIQRENK